MDLSINITTLMKNMIDKVDYIYNEIIGDNAFVKNKSPLKITEKGEDIAKRADAFQIIDR